jgi:hypothetical protein
VQVLPLEIGKLGRKQPGIPFNVSPMAPHLGGIEVNHPPSPLWMVLSRIIDWIEELAAAPDSVDQREVKGRSGTTVSVSFFTKPHI